MTVGAYSFRLQQGQAGQIGDSSIRRIDSKYITAGEIEFGVALAQVLGATDHVAPWTAAANGSVVGISVFDATKIRTLTEVGGKYTGPSDVAVLTFGRILVAPSVQVGGGDKAYLVEGTGAFTNVAAGNTYVGIYITSGGPVGDFPLAELNFDLEVTY
jgi:hypothetical protein